MVYRFKDLSFSCVHKYGEKVVKLMGDPRLYYNN